MEMKSLASDKYSGATAAVQLKWVAFIGPGKVNYESGKPDLSKASQLLLESSTTYCL